MVLIENKYLIAYLDNPIRIIAQQEKPISINQLSATIQAYDSEKQQIEIMERKGNFYIHPDTIGTVEIKIKLSDTTETKRLIVNPLEAVGRLGRHKANSDKKFGVGEFKAQAGIIASIECCDISARCKVLGFRVMRISKKNEVERAVNQGAKFEEKTRKIIRNAKPGDLFIFREIKYRCPGSAYSQRLDNMIFELE